MPVFYNQAALGGTELRAIEFIKYVDPQISDKFYIHFSRYNGPDPENRGLKEILYCQDTHSDPMYDHLKNGGYNKFERVVFASNWQMQNFINFYGIPWYKCAVVKNFIDPVEIVEYSEKPTDKIRLVYQPTPHRGLQILVPVFDRLTKDFPGLLELDVFSSFKIYGWAEADEKYKDLFKQCEDHPDINYHGSKPNLEIKEALKKSHIWGYPCIWLETSCCSLIEAMSAMALCVHPNYGPLSETAANWSMIYQWNQNINDHAGNFYAILKGIIHKHIDLFSNDSLMMGYKSRMALQKICFDQFHSWSSAGKGEWEALLKSMV